jgi:hypothetical protein
LPAGDKFDIAVAEQRFAHRRRVEAASCARPAGLLGRDCVEVILQGLGNSRMSALQHTVAGTGADRPRECLSYRRVRRLRDGGLAWQRGTASLEEPCDDGRTQVAALPGVAGQGRGDLDSCRVQNRDRATPPACPAPVVTGQQAGTAPPFVPRARSRQPAGGQPGRQFTVGHAIGAPGHDASLSV